MPLTIENQITELVNQLRALKTKPDKPRLSGIGDREPDEYRKHAEKLDVYKEELAEWELDNTHNTKIDRQVHELIGEASGLFSLNVTDKQKQKIRIFVGTNFEDSNYYEEYEILSEIVALFEP